MVNAVQTTVVSGLNGVSAKSAGHKTENIAKTEDRVEELKKQIELGEYKFDLQKTAEKVAEALL
ncbi:MAG: flagellar biosynthesis anti-sigma factor FlgM [Helicobacteraceae bacterium]|jgi:anti-sigma28 factor (negative regulator of flagellin synthesis)|nr:flagellar biosynthesis anti-sigma factor FlgM [Helicobacteraceae bacterium]